MEKEKRLLERVVKKGARLAKAVEAAEEEAICALGEAREIEQLLDLTLPLVDELHRRLEEAEMEEEVGMQERVGELQGGVDKALAGRAKTKGVVAAGTGSRAGGAEAASARTGAGSVAADTGGTVAGTSAMVGASSAVKGGVVAAGAHAGAQDGSGRN
eukprot:SAG11_NODE_676_length_7798_cov_33.772438_6_plen_158_part_00